VPVALSLASEKRHATRSATAFFVAAVGATLA
jgi:hypothetical protein